MSSLVSANGPSITVVLPSENRTRLPLELAWSPSAASITPARTNSSLNFPISASSSLVGRTPASESLQALTITMNRIVMSPSLDKSRCLRASICKSNGRPQNRHPCQEIFTINYVYRRRQRRRSSLPLRLGPHRRCPDYPRGRFRLGRRVCPGGLYRRCGSMAGVRCPRVPARLDHPDRPSQGHRPHPAQLAVRGKARII